MSWYANGYEGRLIEKRRADEEELDAYKTVSDTQQSILQGVDNFLLDQEFESDHLDSQELEESENDNPCWDGENQVVECEWTPEEVDHRNHQTPVRHQLDRGTCVCFASLACIEAIFKEQDGSELDLSEQYANWLFMGHRGSDQCDDGLRTTLSARYLTNAGVCQESLWPYEDKTTVNTHCSDQPSNAARSSATFKFTKTAIIDRLGHLGPSIANPQYLECVLSQGYDIVFGTHVAWGRQDTNGVFDVVLDPYGNPLKSRGGHAMLLVGYNRSVPIPYFIFKNSWGTSNGVNGYYYLSYDYVMTYAKYGYIAYGVVR